MGRSLNSIAVIMAAIASAMAMPADINTTLVERQTSMAPCTSSETLVGDGDPHQNFLHKQLSEPITCADASCSAGEADTQSYTITATLGGAADWFTGGFSVAYSWTTGNSYTCNANAGDTVCIWQKIAHTAYTAQSCLPDYGCGGGCDGDKHVLVSPNNNNAGGGYYCVVGTCRAQGDEYWDTYNPKGGPGTT